MDKQAAVVCCVLSDFLNTKTFKYSPVVDFVFVQECCLPRAEDFTEGAAKLHYKANHCSELRKMRREERKKERILFMVRYEQTIHFRILLCTNL